MKIEATKQSTLKMLWEHKDRDPVYFFFKKTPTVKLADMVQHIFQATQVGQVVINNIRDIYKYAHTLNIYITCVCKKIKVNSDAILFTAVTVGSVTPCFDVFNDVLMMVLVSTLNKSNFLRQSTSVLMNHFSDTPPKLSLDFKHTNGADNSGH